MSTLIALPLIVSPSVATAAALGARSLISLIVVTLISAGMALGCMQVLA